MRLFWPFPIKHLDAGIIQHAHHTDQLARQLYIHSSFLFLYDKTNLLYQHYIFNYFDHFQWALDCISYIYLNWLDSIHLFSCFSMTGTNLLHQHQIFNLIHSTVHKWIWLH
jgi:hypothetical protein